MREANIVEDDDSVAIPILDLDAKHELNEQTAYNKKLVVRAKRCGCFHCGSIFDALEITQWLEESDGEDTALCPYCNVDAVVVGSDGFPLSTALLSKLYMEWFNNDYKKVVQEGNRVPDYLGEKEFFRKGIPFQFVDDPQVEIVGEIDLFSSLAFDKAWNEEFGWLGGPIVRFDANESLDDSNNRKDDELHEDESNAIGGILSARAYFNEEGYYCCDLIDSRGRKISYEPWTGKMQDMLLNLTKQYGDRLKGLIKEPFSNHLYLFVRNDC